MHAFLISLADLFSMYRLLTFDITYTKVQGTYLILLVIWLISSGWMGTGSIGSCSSSLISITSSTVGICITSEASSSSLFICIAFESSVFIPAIPVKY